MRCPTTSISAVDASACVWPLHNVLSKCSTAWARDETLTRSRSATPCEFFTATDATSPSHSILPSHRQAGGSAGSVSPISYRHVFWLLEPELSTRIFICQYGQLQFFTSGRSSPCSCTYCLCSTSLSRRNCLK